MQAPTLIMNLLICPVCNHHNWVFFSNPEDEANFCCMNCKTSMQKMEEKYNEQFKNRESDNKSGVHNTYGDTGEQEQSTCTDQISA